MTVNIPVDSQTYVAFTDPHGISTGLRSAKNLTLVSPSIMRQESSLSTSTDPGYCVAKKS